MSAINTSSRSAQQAKHGEQIKRAYNKGGESLANKEAAKKQAAHGTLSVRPGEVSNIKLDRMFDDLKFRQIQDQFKALEERTRFKN